MFTGLSLNDVDFVLSRATVREGRRGAFLFRQGESAKQLYLLQSGRVRLRDSATEHRELLVRFVGPSEIFGDKAIIPGSKYGATAVADTPVRIHLWSTETITRLSGEFPKLTANLLAILSKYLDYSRICYRSLATASAEQRIRWAVTQMADRFGQTQGQSVVISGPAVQSDVADLAVSTISTVNRALKNYEKRGLVTLERGRIIVLPTFR
jgi:CRP-like cAMP-binding protein